MYCHCAHLIYFATEWKFRYDLSMIHAVTSLTFGVPSHSASYLLPPHAKSRNNPYFLTWHELVALGYVT